MELKVLPQKFSICKLASLSGIDYTDEICFLAKTDEELSLVCSAEKVPAGVRQCDPGWRAFRVSGTLDFSLVGILARISVQLANHQISIFAVSTYNTDYILIKEADFDKALKVLERDGYVFH